MAKNLRVATALTATMAVFVLLFVAAAAAAVAALRANQAHIEALGRGNIERANALSDTTARLFQARAQLADAKTFMEGGLEEDRNAALARAETLLESAAQSAARLRANPDAGEARYGAVLAAYANLADQALLPLAAAIKGWNGIQANQLSDKALPAAADAMCGRSMPIRAMRASRAASCWPRPVGWPTAWRWARGCCCWPWARWRC